MRWGLVAAVLLTASARAEPVQPVPYAERPLTLPRLTLSPVAGVSYAHIGLGNTLKHQVDLGLGASFGILDDLTVDAQLVPLRVYPEAAYGNAQLGATYRFLRGVAEVGASASLLFPAPDALAAWLLTLSAPLRVHLGRWARFDGGVGFLFNFVPGRQVVGLSLPMAIAVPATPWGFVSIAGGVTIVSLDNASATTAVPVSLTFGGIVPGARGPLVDIAASLAFPEFLYLSGKSGGGARLGFAPGYFTVGLSARFYIYLR